MKIGIIGAMKDEVESLFAKMENAETARIAGMRFAKGVISGQKAVVAECGIGKINASICAGILIARYGVQAVINTGVAGSLDNRIDIGDFVIAEDAVQHDFDLVPLGLAKGEIPFPDGSCHAFPMDAGLRDLLLESAKESAADKAVFTGRVCSGDQFIASGAEKQRIRDGFCGLCCEMEGAAIAQTCYLYGIPCGIIRAISDKADQSEEKSFAAFAAEAAADCARIVLCLLRKLQEKEG